MENLSKTCLILEKNANKSLRIMGGYRYDYIERCRGTRTK